MKFRRHFSVFALAWAVAVGVLSDILLVSAFRKIELDTEKGSPIPAFFIVPAVFALADILLISGFSLLLTRRLRRRYISLDGHREYAFFRNHVCILAAGAAANTLLLLNRYYSVMEILKKDERRRLHLMFSDNEALRDRRLSELDSLISRCGTAAVIVTVLMILLKAAGYLFSARRLVKTYHKNARSGYSQEVKI